MATLPQGFSSNETNASVPLPDKEGRLTRTIAGKATWSSE
jgi:hypothetical protein